MKKLFLIVYVVLFSFNSYGDCRIPLMVEVASKLDVKLSQSYGKGELHSQKTGDWTFTFTRDWITRGYHKDETAPYASMFLVVPALVILDTAMLPISGVMTLGDQVSRLGETAVKQIKSNIDRKGLTGKIGVTKALFEAYSDTGTQTAMEKLAKLRGKSITYVRSKIKLMNSSKSNTFCNDKGPSNLEEMAKML